jgi:acyl-CoA dehydrogenase
MQFANLGYSEEQIDLLDVAANFCRDKSPMDQVRVLMDSEHGYNSGAWAEIVALGWTAISIPESYGGIGLSLAEIVPIAEQMGRRMMASPFIANALCTQALIAAGTPKQQQKYLPQLASGAIASLALYETGGDWHLPHISATATSDGEILKLSGDKLFVSWARDAKFIIASVLVDGAPALVIIDADNIPAGALRREAIVDETRRSFALCLDNITVPAEALCDGAKTDVALAHIDLAAALLQAAEMCGGTQAVIDYTVDYMKTRTQFGKVIGEYQALKHPIVNAYVDYEKARSHLYSAAYSFADQGEGEIAVRMAKVAAEKAYSYAADRAVQFHGGFGFTHDCDAGLHRRAAIFHASQHGDAAWHRAKLADLLLG